MVPFRVMITGKPLNAKTRIFTSYLRGPLKVTLTLLVDLHIGVIFPVGVNVREHFSAVGDAPAVQVARAVQVVQLAFAS